MRLARVLVLAIAGVCPIGMADAGGTPPVQVEPATGGHWAYQPISRAEPPPDRQGWSTHPIDRFLRASQAALGVVPVADADRRTLIRRVTFDLLGLPPTPAEIQAFVSDGASGSREKLVERLLASERYGERWGRHWLDVVRYADTAGFEHDPMYPSAFRYRDYVIQSLNADKPFDRFIQEQVAGDELWPADQSAAVATGLYCVGPVLEESAMTPNQLEYDWLIDATDTTGAAFLGLTIGCARCHDHKYDPITQADYFAMQAIFAASDRPYRNELRERQIKALNGLLSEGALPDRLKNDPRCELKTEAQAGFGLFHRDEPLEVHRLHRGEVNKPREVAVPGLPEFLSLATAPDEPNMTAPERRRTTLARWLTSTKSPLTARVIVNRVWGWHFGEGLVRTPNDFGNQGDPPTHPELLDWLARDFMDHGWSLKHLHRQILSSRSYQLRSIGDEAGRAKDPGNRLLWHFPRRRLEGEAIRDSMLACSGTLNLEMFGPPVVPPLSAQELTGLFDAKVKWPVTKDASQSSRRSVYLLVRRTFTYPMFAAFDSPEVMASCARRQRTVVPTQALALLNGPQAHELSRAFANRLLAESGTDLERVVSQAWLLAFGRNPRPAEQERAIAFVNKSAAARDARSGALFPIDQSLGLVLADLCLALFNSNEFICVD
jgi:hypothetical protein